MSETHETLQGLVNEIEDAKAAYNEEVEKNAEDGVLTKEEEMEEPENILFNAISDTTVNILKDSAITEQFKTVVEGMGESVAGALMAITAITTTHAAYQAVVFHDELLKKELIKQFDSFAYHINETKGILGECQARLTVLEKKVDLLMEHKKLEEIDPMING